MALTRYGTISDTVEAVSRAAGIIKLGQAVDRKAELGACVFTIQGFAMKSTLGDYVDLNASASDDPNAIAEDGGPVTYQQVEELTFQMADLADACGVSYALPSEGYSKVDWKAFWQKIKPVLIKYLPEIIDALT